MSIYNTFPKITIHIKVGYISKHFFNTDATNHFISYKNCLKNTS